MLDEMVIKRIIETLILEEIIKRHYNISNVILNIDKKGKDINKYQHLLQKENKLWELSEKYDEYYKMLNNISILKYPITTETWLSLINENQKIYHDLDEDMNLLVLAYKLDKKLSL